MYIIECEHLYKDSYRKKSKKKKRGGVKKKKKKEKRQNFYCVEYHDQFPSKIISTRIMTVSVLLRLPGRVIPQVFFLTYRHKEGREEKRVFFFFFFFFSKDLFFSKILPVILIQPGSVRVSVLIQDIEKRRTSVLFTFIIRRNWEGNDACRFS